jgi:hypothetical protein
MIKLSRKVAPADAEEERPTRRPGAAQSCPPHPTWGEREAGVAQLMARGAVREGPPQGSRNVSAPVATAPLMSLREARIPRQANFMRGDAGREGRG